MAERCSNPVAATRKIIMEYLVLFTIVGLHYYYVFHYTKHLHKNLDDFSDNSGPVDFDL